MGPLVIPLLMAAASAAASKLGSKSSNAAKNLKAVGDPPSADQLQLKLQELVSAGQLSPEDARAILQGPSAYETIQTDPRLRGQQLDSLAQYQTIAGAGGLDARARADLEQALESQRTETRGAREAIMANARARGIGGSDLELVNQLVAQQGAAQRGSQAALQTAALGETRRDQALANAAALAGNVRTQDFGEASTKAAAQDALSRFNATNMQNVELANVQARNQAQAANLANRQDIANQNVGLRNEALKYNANLPLDLYALRTNQAINRTNAQLADEQIRQGNNQMLAGLGGSALQAYATYAKSDERSKTDVQDVDSRDVLRDLSSASWRYKGDRERHVGPMAQDFEKGPLADYVIEGPDRMKMVDYGGMGFESGEEGGLVMSLLSDISKRLERVEGGRKRA